MLKQVMWAACMAAVLSSAAATAEETKIDASRGGVTIQSGDNSLTFGARAQFRYTADDREEFDADIVGPGAGVEDGLSQQFAVQRMRLSFKGGVWKPWLKYEFQFELSNTDGAKDNKVKDAVIEIVKTEKAVLKMGQFKTPFSLQDLTSSGRQQFVDRAITNKKFAPGRDQGVQIGGLFAEKKFGYAAGVFNGSGESQVQDDKGMMWVARAWFDPLGEYKLHESAFDNPEKNVLHFGLGMRTGEAHRGLAVTGAFDDPDNETAYNLELAWRYRRFFATGEAFMMSNEVTAAVLDPNGAPTGSFQSAPDLDSSGWHAQGGVFLKPKTIEVGLRYAEIDLNDDGNDDKITESRFVFGYYFTGHNLKLQADAGQIVFEKNVAANSLLAARNLPALDITRRLSGLGREYTDLQYRIQMQVSF